MSRNLTAIESSDPPGHKPPLTKSSNHISIKYWPLAERPREKLLKRGENSLDNSELLAILLRTGGQGQSAIDLARIILDRFGSFRNMSQSDARDWHELKGLGPSKIAQIKAALEIGRRFREDEATRYRQKVGSSKDIINILTPQMRDLKTEVFKVIYLDAHNQIIEVCTAAAGTVDHAVPIIREIVHGALQKYAASIICAHNHPSGNTQPSSQDKQFTKELIDATRLMGIKLLDHVIIGDNQFYSFTDEGMIASV